MWHGVYLLGIFIIFGVVPLNFIIKGLRALGAPYWLRIALGVIYLFAVTELAGKLLS